MQGVREAIYLFVIAGRMARITGRDAPLESCLLFFTARSALTSNGHVMSIVVRVQGAGLEGNTTHTTLTQRAARCALTPVRVASLWLVQSHS